MSEQPIQEQPTSMLSVVEALLFASDEPLAPQQIADILTLMQGGDQDRGRRRSAETVERSIQDLNELYREEGRAFRIVEIAGGYQFATRPEFGVWIGAMMKEKAKRKLSVSALESLAVIAYRQPVTKPELEAIRGVNADYVIRTLLERNLITIVGRAATPGRPLLYGTTRDFLKHFGLKDLAELPKPREINELLAEAEYEVEKRLLKEREAQAAAEGDVGTEAEDAERTSPEGGSPPAT